MASSRIAQQRKMTTRYYLVGGAGKKEKKKGKKEKKGGREEGRAEGRKRRREGGREEKIQYTFPTLQQVSLADSTTGHNRPLSNCLHCGVVPGLSSGQCETHNNLPGLEHWGMQAKGVPDWEPIGVGGCGWLEVRPKAGNYTCSIAETKLKSEPVTQLTLTKTNRPRTKSFPSEFTNLISTYKVGIMGGSQTKECDCLF